MNVEREVWGLLMAAAPGWNGDMNTAPDIGSLEYLELMFEIEERFAVEFPGDISDLKTPCDLVRYITKVLNARPDQGR